LNFVFSYMKDTQEQMTKAKDTLTYLVKWYCTYAKLFNVLLMLLNCSDETNPRIISGE